MTTSPSKEIMMGWKTSRTIEAIKKGLAGLSSFDPFNGLNPVLAESPNTEECFDISELDEIKY